MEQLKASVVADIEKSWTESGATSKNNQLGMTPQVSKILILLKRALVVC